MPIHGITATYQPFSLQERMAPLAMMKEEYDKINEGLAELGMTANQAAQYIDPESEAGRVLAQYNQTLDDAAGTLSREGLKGLSRTALYNLKRAYQSQIAPINESAKNYFTLQGKIKELQWKDPTIMVSDMPSLDDYIKNPNRLPNLVSGAQLMQEGATAALQLPGVDYDSISRYLKGDASAIPNINESVQRIAQSYGVSSQQAMDYISRGVISGLGQRATKLADAEKAAEMEFDYKMRLEKYKVGVKSGRAKRSLDASMLLQGYVPDGKGGYKFDEEAFKNAQRSAQATTRTRGTRTSGSSSQTKETPQNHNRTPGVTVYNSDGTVYDNADNDIKAKEIKVGNRKISDDKVKRDPKTFMELSDSEKIVALRHSRQKGIIDSDVASGDSPYMKADGTYNWDEVYADFGGILDLYTYTEITDKSGNKYVMIGSSGTGAKTTTPPSSSSRADDAARRAGVEQPGGSEDDGSNYEPQQ